MKDIEFGGHVFSKAKFPETLLATETQETTETETDSLTSEQNSSPVIITPKVEPDTTVHNVLVFGDSMTHHLAMSIAKYGTKNSYKVTGVTWESSSIPGWNQSGKVKKYLEEVKPDFVIISLGSNELGLKHFEARVPEIKKLTEQLGDLPYIWVGPPLWKEDPGVYPMLEKALPKGVLFHTEGIDIPRGGDHIHPTRKGADVWADTIMRWMPTTPHPILAEIPDSATTTKGHKFIYLHPDD